MRILKAFFKGYTLAFGVVTLLFTGIFTPIAIYNGHYNAAEAVFLGALAFANGCGFFGGMYYVIEAEIVGGGY